jgi:hypothetical protein
MAAAAATVEAAVTDGKAVEMAAAAAEEEEAVAEAKEKEIGRALTQG